ncbi:HlyD family secretion protein [Chachezhania sediminis]|uniref:HlyD family secretion protein n=1 Tax=Chachezhania sediminis TaxID=2599291 RepID=UPI00131B6629|nr:HlyD family efflux transporter periplasmic adaptor subunit [Chachezhania sediminis]
MTRNRRKLLVFGAAILACVAAFTAWSVLTDPGLPDGIATGNGRIEGTEIEIAALAGGRIAEITVDEGQIVQKGDVLVRMDTVLLEAQKRQAEAALERAKVAIETAKSIVAQAEAQKTAAEAAVAQAEAGQTLAEAEVARSKSLAKNNIVAQQVLDADIADYKRAEATVASAKANVIAAEATIGSARAQVNDAEAAVDSAKAQIDYVTKQIEDSTLTSPREGRIQYLVAREGEVVSAGARILSLVDLTDIYMTFFLPTAQAGRVAVGAEARLVMDAAPDYVLPAHISYVADVAQFTPKTVEAPDERDKLMFRVRARIDSALLEKYITYVKTGLPGDAYVKTDPDTPWPAFLTNVVQ